jgi:hypothetical protein
VRAGCGRRWRAPTRIFGILPVHRNWDHDYQHERIGDLDSWGASDNMHAVCDLQQYCKVLRWTATLIETLLGGLQKWEFSHVSNGVTKV